MSNSFNYKGYLGLVEYSDEDSTFFGKILGIDDLVTFEGSSVEELKKAFHDAVDDYLETCAELSKVPEKAYKGQFNVRVATELHRAAAIRAEAQRMTLNKFVETALKRALQSE
jgi:predicted HicB family RNase H-like nuclease